MQGLAINIKKVRKTMEENLQAVLKEYIGDIEDVCNLLIRGINYSENLNLRNKYDFFKYRSSRKKMDFQVEGVSYQFHGKGCTAFSKERFWDWDFGYRSRWCGINPWKVSMTLKKNNRPYIEYYDGNFLETACEQLVEKGIMFKQYDQYYFEITAGETFKPEFPTEYDTLIIEYCNLSWAVPRNKITDRFIRKSTWVSNQIDQKQDRYVLKFLLEGKVIYTIPYSDDDYPENSVKIMSDEILKNLLNKKYK